MGLGVIFACFAGCSSGRTPEGGEGMPEHERNEYYRSFWNTDTIKNETVMLEEDKNGKISGKLLYTPTDILSVKNFDLTINYPMSGFLLN